MNKDGIETQLIDILAGTGAQDELSAEEFNLVSGGYPCSYLGVYDYSRMQSYASRNYSC